MFILYINDISEGTQSTVKLFADDCLLFRKIRTPLDGTTLQQDLDIMCSWARTWQMSFNPDKCSILTITRRTKTIKTTYTMLGKTLAHYDHHPYLGVELSSGMDWGHHVKNTVAKGQRSLNVLRRNLSGCSQETKSKAYTTMVRPILEYASNVWDPFQGTQIAALEAVQRRAARFACRNYSREASVTAMLNSLGWRLLQERRFISRQAMFFRAIKQQTATLLPSYITPPPARSIRSSHDTRYVVPSGNADYYRHSYFPRTVRAWNILPDHVVQAQDVDTFKDLLRKEFLDGHMYMVAPKNTEDTLRLGSTSSVRSVGAIY